MLIHDLNIILPPLAPLHFRKSVGGELSWHGWSSLNAATFCRWVQSGRRRRVSAAGTAFGTWLTYIHIYGTMKKSWTNKTHWIYVSSEWCRRSRQRQRGTGSPAQCVFLRTLRSHGIVGQTRSLRQRCWPLVSQFRCTMHLPLPRGFFSLLFLNFCLLLTLLPLLFSLFFISLYMVKKFIRLEKNWINCMQTKTFYSFWIPRNVSSVLKIDLSFTSAFNGWVVIFKIFRVKNCMELETFFWDMTFFHVSLN